jgi:hypothetical protein
VAGTNLRKTARYAGENCDPLHLHSDFDHDGFSDRVHYRRDRQGLDLRVYLWRQHRVLVSLGLESLARSEKIHVGLPFDCRFEMWPGDMLGNGAWALGKNDPVALG